MTSVFIEKIEELKKNDNVDSWIGYKIHMSDSSKNIICKISNDRVCCENYDVVFDESINKNDFIGAEYLSVKVVYPDDTLDDDKYNDETQEVRVIINTSIGEMKLYIYNEHNGYYRHEYYLQTEDKRENGYL
jgi:hypothetical protein